MPRVGTIRIPGTGRQAVLKLRRFLEHPEPILRQIGIILLADAQKAFKEQRLGDIAWPARYPGQGPPHVNIAGAVADFLAGRKAPLERRFQNRPAGIDTGQTLRSLTFGSAVSLRGYEVTVRSATPGAENLQGGGTTTQLVTRQVKERLAAWMGRTRKAVKRFKGREETKTRGGKTKYLSTAKARAEAAKKLGFLFQKTSLVTEVARRPFFGVTDEGFSKMLRAIGGEFMRKFGSGRAGGTA